MEKSGDRIVGKNLTHQTFQLRKGVHQSMDFDGSKKVKIIQVLKCLNPGGIETWLMHALRSIDRQKFKIDFIVHKSGIFDAEVEALGSEVILCPYHYDPFTYAAKFLGLIRKHGPYQIIHTQFPRSGYYHLLAWYAGIPIRLHHCHNDENIRRNHISSWRGFSIAMSYRLVREFATYGLAVSRIAATGAFGPDWQSDQRWRVFPASIDLSPFSGSVNREEIRDELGLPKSAFIMGHVGRFDFQKNHSFLIDIAAEVCRRMPEAYLLLIGDGPLRPAMEEKVARLGIERRVIFTGIRRDVPKLLKGAIDIFVFPSFFEGLPCVLMEAQAAGLPCLISDSIADESEVIPGLMQRFSLTKGAHGWSEAILAARDNRVRLSPAEAIEKMGGTMFDIDTNVRHMEELYLAALVAKP
jgi:glycosyltransferase involved in cell wall biosynthesis